MKSLKVDNYEKKRILLLHEFKKSGKSITEDDKTNMFDKNYKGPLMTTTDYANYPNSSMSSVDRMKALGKKGSIPQVIKVEGSDNFKSGKDQIDPNAQGIKNAVFQIRNINQQGGGSVTVNGSSSDTQWGNFKAGSPEAKKKNEELASKRRDNMVAYLNSLNLPNVKIVKGTAKVSDFDNPETAQNVNMVISGTKMIDIDPKGDIGDNTRTPGYLYQKNAPKKNDPKKNDIIPNPTNVKQIRVATKVPEIYVSELEQIIKKWGKSKNLNLGVANGYKYKISIQKK
jgi:hypothetical protein